MTLLEAVGISKRFGGIAALMPVSLAIEEGEFVGLVGQNGAGKTTLFNCLLGIDHPDTGTISFRRAPHRPPADVSTCPARYRSDVPARSSSSQG